MYVYMFLVWVYIMRGRLRGDTVTQSIILGHLANVRKWRHDGWATYAWDRDERKNCFFAKTRKKSDHKGGFMCTWIYLWHTQHVHESSVHPFVYIHIYIYCIYIYVCMWPYKSTYNYLHIIVHIYICTYIYILYYASGYKHPYLSPESHAQNIQCKAIQNKRHIMCMMHIIYIIYMQYYIYIYIHTYICAYNYVHIHKSF